MTRRSRALGGGRASGTDERVHPALAPPPPPPPPAAAAQIDAFLLAAEACGCRLLDSNVHRLARVLHELALITDGALYPALRAVGWGATAEHLREEDAWAEAQLHAVLELMGEADEERLARNYARVAELLEGLLPPLKEHMAELAGECVPHLLETLPPAQAAALADAIRATQQRMLDAQAARQAAATAAFLKTRAGRRAALLEAQQRDAEERRE